MRSKKEILKQHDYDVTIAVQEKIEERYAFEELLLELLADLRDEQVLLNKTLSAVLAGLLVPVQQGGKR